MTGATPRRTALALLLLAGSGVAMLLLCLLVAEGRALAAGASVVLDAATLLNASPRKAAFLQQFSLGLSAVVSLTAGWLLRGETWRFVALALLAAQPALLLPPLMLGATTNPALARLSQHFEVAELQWPLWPQWSDPAAAVRQGRRWDMFHATVHAWIDGQAGALPLPAALGDDPATRRAIATMHLVSQLWAPGNLRQPQREGCVRSNEDSQWRAIAPAEADLGTYLGARIGCCDDFAHMLVWLLQRDGVQARLVTASGHIFVEAWLRGGWRVLDAQSNAYVDQPFARFNTPGPRTTVLLASHAASLPGHPLHRPHWSIDRWRLLSTLLVGGLAAELREAAPAPFPQAQRGAAGPVVPGRSARIVGYLQQG